MIQIYFENGSVATVTKDTTKSIQFGDNSLVVVFKDGRETVFPYANVLRFEKT